jgi:hypothetical protein
VRDGWIIYAIFGVQQLATRANAHLANGARYGRARRSKRLIPRQTRAAGSGEASKFSSSDSSEDGTRSGGDGTRSGGDGTRSGGDGTRSGGDGSRKSSCSSRNHEVRSRNGGTPPGPMRYPLKAPKWLLLREQELLSYLSSVVLS